MSELSLASTHAAYPLGRGFPGVSIEQEQATTYWVSDDCDTWDVRVPHGVDLEAIILASLRAYDAGDPGNESQHICVDYGIIDEDGDRERHGSITKTAHPKEWSDGKGWLLLTTHGSGGGVAQTWSKDGRRAIVDTWYQYPHNGQVCQDDHVTIKDEDA